MSGETSEEKTLPASPRKLKKLREKGQIPQSKDMVTAVTTIAAFTYLWISSGRFVEAFKASSRAVLIADQENFFFTATEVIKIFAIQLGGFLGFLVLLVIGLSTLTNFIVNKGIVFTLEPLSPKFNKMNPVEGFKKLLSTKVIIELVKIVIKISIFLLLTYVALSLRLNAPFDVPFCGYDCIRTAFMALLYPIFLIGAALLLLVGLADIGLQRWLFLKEQKMTKTEAKREHKDQEMSNETKRARKRLSVQARKASNYSFDHITFIVNGYSSAVGFRYISGETPLPIVVTKGRGKLQQAAIDYAKYKQIPVHDDEDFVMNLYRKLEVGSYLTEEFFEPYLIAMRAKEKN